MSGGFWASMYRVPVTGWPDGTPEQVVVRSAPDLALGAKESAVQGAVADQGFPTPAVLLSHADDDHWWTVMEFCPGVPLLADLDGLAALRRAPALLRTLPVHLAVTAAALHRLDPEPVTAAVAAAAPGVPWSTTDLLDSLDSACRDIDRPDLSAAVQRLRTMAPRGAPEVVCHGDLHPFNVLAEGDELVVVDWTAALLADPCFDLALTELLLANPPLPVRRPLDVAIRGVGAVVARRFLRAYRRANPHTSLRALDWHRALHSARILVELSHLRAKYGDGAGGHPWNAVAPAAVRALEATTSVDIRP